MREIIVNDADLKYKSLNEMLKAACIEDPKKLAMVFEGCSKDCDCITLTYEDLWSASVDAAVQISRHDVGASDRVLILLPNSAEFVAAYFGCLLLGAIPVPMAPNFDARRYEESRKKLGHIIRNCEPKLLVSVEYLVDKLPSYENSVDVFLIEMKKELALNNVDLSYIDLPKSSDLAMIQYTSGSTNDPKGVMLSHGNLLHNLYGITKTFDPDPDRDAVVSWLPLHHDMGLIGMMLASVYSRVPIVISTPINFIKRPQSWFDLIEKYQATITAAPNFALSLAARRCNANKSDLSTLRVLMNGAEPINCEDQRKFSEKFADCGFNNAAFIPGYGLAEACVAVSFNNGKSPSSDFLDRASLSKHKVVRTTPGDSNSIEIACVGKVIHNHYLRIVDSQGNGLSDDDIGEIEVAGPSVMQGYYGDQYSLVEKNIWLRTGDLGYLKNDNLFVTGRTKDLIVHNGVNWYPQDIEAHISVLDKVRSGKVAAFWVERSEQPKEGLVVLVETKDYQSHKSQQASLLQSIGLAITKQCALPIREIRLVKPGSIPLTSSGKVRRQAAKASYLSSQNQDFYINEAEKI